MLRDMQLEMLALFGNLVRQCECLQMQLCIPSGRCRHLRSILDFFQSADFIFNQSDLFLIILYSFTLHLQIFPQRHLPLPDQQVTLIAVNQLHSLPDFVHYLFIIYFRPVDWLFNLCDIGIEGLLTDQSAFAGGGTDEFGAGGWRSGR